MHYFMHEIMQLISVRVNTWCARYRPAAWAANPNQWDTVEADIPL